MTTIIILLYQIYSYNGYTFTHLYNHNGYNTTKVIVIIATYLYHQTITIVIQL